MTFCYKNLTLGVLSSRTALSLLVGALFKKFGLFLNTPRIHKACIIPGWLVKHAVWKPPALLVCSP